MVLRSNVIMGEGYFSKEIKANCELIEVVGNYEFYKTPDGKLAIYTTGYHSGVPY